MGVTRPEVINELQRIIDQWDEQHDDDFLFLDIEYAKPMLALLKKQEPIEPEYEGDSRSSWWYVCGECHGAIDHKDQFCRHCGRPVKWK